MPVLYTRTGDDGTTGLLGSQRVSKNDLRLEAIGSLDESVAALGMARSQSKVEKSREILLQVQRDLYHLMAEIASSPENVNKFRVIGNSHVNWIEDQVDTIGQIVQMPGEFIVPGDMPEAACFDVARTVVRRAERRLVALNQSEEILNPELLRYLNRLSSLCFILELFELQVGGKNNPTLARIE